VPLRELSKALLSLSDVRTIWRHHQRDGYVEMISLVVCRILRIEAKLTACPDESASIGLSLENVGKIHSAFPTQIDAAIFHPAKHCRIFFEESHPASLAAVGTISTTTSPGWSIWHSSSQKPIGRPLR